MIIIGGLKQTMKQCGQTPHNNCTRCNNIVHSRLLKVTSWFTFFFIPLIPYKVRYVAACPICNQVKYLSKEDFFEMSGHIFDSEATETTGKYAGKTATQIAYLKQMEEIDKERTKEG